MRKILSVLFLLLLGATASAQPLSFNVKTASLTTAMATLAQDALAQWTRTPSADRERQLTTLLRLQLVAAQAAQALDTLAQLRALQAGQGLADSELSFVQYELYARALLLNEQESIPFDDAFTRVFRSSFQALSPPKAYRASLAFTVDLASAEQALQQSLAALKPTEPLAIDKALNLLRDYLPCMVYRRIAASAAVLLDEDDAARYTMDKALIKTADGASLIAYVVKPQAAPQAPLPTALVFTIYAEAQRPWSVAQQAAAQGFVGVVAFSRGKAGSPDVIAPYEHEASDVNAVIGWISRQRWSDGQVGMYGGSYNGFSQWAALKHPHPALKTIVPYVAAIPGLGLPMENNVFLNANYGWAFYVSNTPFLDNQIYDDRQRWNALPERWFESGRRYREIDTVDGTPNPLLQRWLAHPAFDAYWQAMVPYGDDFARIKIPVLSITGFYDDGQISAIEYVKQHYQHNPQARHYLLIGPYDHIAAQNYRKPVVLRGYAIDPVAQFSTPAITFEWLNHVLRGGPLPGLLQDRINFQIMGTNRWGHAPSMQALSAHPRKLYLSDTRQLTAIKPTRAAALTQVINFKDRAHSNNEGYYPSPILRPQPDTPTGLVFTSEPLPEATTLAGTFSGLLRISINKRDVDLGVQLYELTPEGDYLHLSYFLGRASYAQDMSRRHLLSPGRISAVPFTRTRMVARELRKGSRLVVVVDVNKNSGAQLNHGTGRDVSDESIADAAVPLLIRWYNDSYVSLPLSR